MSKVLTILLCTLLIAGCKSGGGGGGSSSGTPSVVTTGVQEPYFPTEPQGEFPGDGECPNGPTRTAVLDPIPEPSTLILFGIGLSGLAAGAFRRKKK